MKNNSSIYHRKMDKNELSEHMKLSTRSRQFVDKKKEKNKKLCRQKFTF